MKTRTVLFFALLAALALSGCSTVNSRIRQKSEVFASLPAADQERLRQRRVSVGDTPDMVFIALGRPDVRRVRSRETEEEREWIYRSYSSEYAGSQFVGYRRRLAYDPRTQRSFVYLEPQYAAVYREHEEDDIRVVFTGNRVSAIVQRTR